MNEPHEPESRTPVVCDVRALLLAEQIVASTAADFWFGCKNSIFPQKDTNVHMNAPQNHYFPEDKIPPLEETFMPGILRMSKFD